MPILKATQAVPPRQSNYLVQVRIADYHRELDPQWTHQKQSSRSVQCSQHGEIVGRISRT